MRSGTRHGRARCMATSNSADRATGHGPHDPVRLGVISFAHAHINAYIETIRELDDAVVVAAWDDDRERGTTQCAKYGLHFEPDLDTLLRRDDIDAVFVT